MIYFSDIIYKKVVTEDGIPVGKLNDLVFCYTDIPYVTKLLVKPDRSLFKGKLYIPAKEVIKYNDKIVLRKNYTTSTLSNNELFMLRNLMDKQIIDIEGSKVVRVNDVAMQDTSDKKLTIASVDIGLTGVLRWIKLEKVYEKICRLLNKKPQINMLAWSEIQPLELGRGKVLLNTKEDKLKKLHPADVADYLESTNIKNIGKIVDTLDRNFASDVIAELNLNYQVALFHKFSSEKAGKILSQLDPDDAVDILSNLRANKRKNILEHIEPNKRSAIEKLLNYEDTQVGHYLTTNYAICYVYETAGNVISKLRKETSDLEYVRYIYALNENDQIVGAFSVYELLMQNSDTPVYKFMKQGLIVAHIHTPINTVFRKMIKYKLSALPVIDAQKKILGVIALDDIGELFIEQYE